MVESVVAGIVLLVCAALLLRQALSPARRHGVDAAVRRLLRRAGWHLGRLRARLARRSRLERDVEREAHDVIERARRQARDATAARDRRRDTLH